MKLRIFIILIMFPGLFLKAQEYEVKATLDTFQIEIGDQVNFKLNVVQPVGLTVAFPKFKNQLIEGIDIVSIGSYDTITTAKNQYSISQAIKITSFEDSLFNIPPFAFISERDTVYSNSISFDVHMVQIDSATISKIDTNQVLKIFDVKSPIDTPFTLKEFFQNYYPYILGFIVLALIVFLTMYIIKRYKENKPIFKISKPKEPAHIIALRDLDALKQKKLWQSGKEKAYYSELTHILREYIENRFDMIALERTSYELIEALKQNKIIEDELVAKLYEILKLADLAKFAKFKPLADENDLSLKNAYLIIERTIPVIEETNEEEQIEDGIPNMENIQSVNSKMNKE